MDSGLSNAYIYKVLKKQLKLSRFVDVYSADTINVELLRDMDKFTFVCNLAKVGMPGTHFVCT